MPSACRRAPARAVAACWSRSAASFQTVSAAVTTSVMVANAFFISRTAAAMVTVTTPLPVRSRRASGCTAWVSRTDDAVFSRLEISISRAGEGRRELASSSPALSTTAEYALKVSHSAASAVAATSQRCRDSPVRVAPASSRLPKLLSRSSRLAWIVSRSRAAASTPATASSLDE